PSFPAGDHGETAKAAMGQRVGPVASLGNRHQQGVATRRRYRRVVSRHMDDALRGGLQRARPRDGDIDGTVQLLADGTACVLIRIGLYRCIADLAQLQLDVGLSVTRSTWRSTSSRSPPKASMPFACRWLRNAALMSASISAAGTRPIAPAARGFLCSTAW